MLSIAICTYNREDQLERILGQFEAIKNWLHLYAELIVIDNNSCDGTQRVAQAYQKKFNLRLIKEETQGLSSARNRAIKEFKGDALLFLDDDVSITLAALDAYRERLLSETQAGYFGGKIRVDWQGEPPKWLKSNDLVLLNGLFGQYDLGDETRYYNESTPMPFGANFVLRRALIEQVGLFDISLGVNGNSIGRGEETDYFQRAKSQGFKGVYCAKAVVGHIFQQERINLSYLYRYGIEKGRAAYLLDKHSAGKWRTESFIFFIKGAYQLIKGRRDRFYQCIINMGIRKGIWQESTGSTRHKND